MRPFIPAIVRLTLALTGCAAVAQAQWNPPTRFGTTPPMAGAEFGRAAALDGDWAAVAARRFGSSPSQAGAVFLYQRSAGGWSGAGMLQASDRTANDEFGTSVALHGDWLAVGASLDDPRGTSSGSAYIFQHSGAGWTQFARLVPSDGQTLDQFGAAVAMGSDWMFTGAPFDDDRGVDAGAAYAFQFDGQAWVQSAKLTTGVGGDQFGAAASMSGDAVAIAAPMDDARGIDAGAVHVFRRTGAMWGLEATLRAADGAGGDRFGGALSLDGDTLLVGASRDDRSGAIDHGSAYVFRRVGGQWTQEGKLVPADSAGNDFFGSSLALRGARALIGANFDDDRGINSGSAYVYEFAGGVWSQTDKFVAADGASQDWFGSAAALGDDVAMLGAPGDDDGGDASGSMYLFAYAPSNLPPSCTLPALMEAECQGQTTSVALDGSAASDPDLDPLEFFWTVDRSEASLDDAHSATPNLSISTGGLCPFDCRVTLTVTDPLGESATCEMIVRVLDTTAPVLSCPERVAVEPGGSLDPADTGTPTVTDCDPDLDLSYSDSVLHENCLSSPLQFKTIRMWTATDRCGNSSSCSQALNQARAVLPLDFKPGDCPNVHNPRSQGHLKVLLMGSSQISAEMIDLTSIRMRRADCQMGEVAPHAGSPGPTPQTIDLGGAAWAEDVSCNPLVLDGLNDLVLQFDSAALDSTLGLSALAGTRVAIAITGLLSAPGSPLDGAEFLAIDELELTAAPKPAEPTPAKSPRGPNKPTPAALPAQFDDLSMLPDGCGAGVGLALPLSLMGLLGMRRQR